MFRHIGIVVRDLELMSKFYQEVIGLELMYDKIEEGEFLEHIVGKKGARAHIHKLGKNGNTIVELLKWDEIYEPDQPESYKLFTHGVTHFALTVNNVEETLNKTHHPISQPKISPDGKFKVTFCHDPEGNLIELVECVSTQG